MTAPSPPPASVDPVAQGDEGTPDLPGLPPQEERHRPEKRSPGDQQDYHRGEFVRRHGDTFDRAATMRDYNFAYLDEQTKRMIRRAILKGIAVPGYQVPFASREMPMPYGWGTGGVQVTAACLVPEDKLKVIDQGADDTTNAVSIRRFFQRTAGVATTEATTEATVIQTRHRIPETPLTEGQILVYQVPIPEPLRFLEPRETETRKMHELEEYGLMHVKLYEDIARHGTIATSYAYPVKVEGRYVMDPSPIPKFDNPKLTANPAIQLFGAGREQRIYALPPWTEVVSLDFDDHPFKATKAAHDCDLCGAKDSYLDEVITDDAGGRMFVCSDTDFCAGRRARGMKGRLWAAEPEGAA
jgi:alpha-D-ribose 1-methylphosphonate 5-phosphate C-P lyase